MILWKNPLEYPALHIDTVHLWRANLDLSPTQVDRLMSGLSADEITRANRFRFVEHKRRFIVTRGILRQLLGNYLNISPKNIKFDYGDRGKPQIDQTNLDYSLQFNISHSQEYALFGFTTNYAIGVDLEYLRAMPDATKIAQRFFTARESNLITNLALDQQPGAFFKLWTAKEAYLKAIGTGLSGSLASLDLELDSQGCTSLVCINGNASAANNWSIYSFTPVTNYVATMAIETKLTEQQINFWHWDEQL